METDILGEMLHFIYTGVVHDHVLKEKAGDLLAAAESYQLNVLKKICEAVSLPCLGSSIEFHEQTVLQNLVYNHPALVLELSKAVEEYNE